MNSTRSSRTPLSRHRALLAVSMIGIALLTGTLHARPIPANLGNGLDKLVNSHLALAKARTDGTTLDGLVEANGQTYLDAATAAIAAHSLHDAATGRVLVRVTLNGTDTFANTRAAMQAAAASLTITAEDTKYRGVGILNAYVAVADAAALARVPGVAAVILEWRPHHRQSADAADRPLVPAATVGEKLTLLGTAFDQGVTQHRVDLINKYYNPAAKQDFEGAGMQIACISNSFNAHSANPASVDVNNFDLPGASANPVNKTPVYVFEDDTSDSQSDDEGRGMCQIAYKMAPKARIAFGTADDGEVGFANNIRGLAGISGFTKSGQTFAADTICDDVGYTDEPMFQDGIIADGIDDASAAGACYFSSAGNDIGTSGYDSNLHWITNDPTKSGALTAAGGNTALLNTNIDLTGVPKALYAGGFHNFNPNGSVTAKTTDVAQLVNDDPDDETPTVLQWNEPYDQTATPTKKQLWTQSGDYESSDDDAYTFTITPSLTAGSTYELDEVAASGSSFDGAITIKAPDGSTVVARQDNDINETVRFRATVTGTGYKVIVGHYETTEGKYTLTLYSTSFSGNTVETQINLLVFDTAGKYLPDESLTADGRATDEPLQIGNTYDPDNAQVQFVIARSNVPAAAPDVATRVRYLLPGDGYSGLGPAQYINYNTPTLYGHPMAATCNGCAAYSVFRPSLPETFTSPGPATIYFDKNNNRLSTPTVRQQPTVAAADGGNVSSNMNGYFADDDSEDPDTSGNFYGTSAAGPHAAAIAALVQEAKGGRHSITPAQMTSLLERSAFPHDLDPNYASGVANVSTGGTVTITVISNDSTDPNVGGDNAGTTTVAYAGGGSSLTSLVFNPAGTASTGGNPSGGNNGVAYAAGKDGTGTYFEHSLPGVSFFPSDRAFKLGSGVTGAKAAFSNSSSGSTGQFNTMTLTIPTGNMPAGRALHFTVGRGLTRSADTGNGGTTVVNATGGAEFYVADILGGGVTLPSGAVNRTGLAFSGKTADGGTFSGTMSNRIGAGYTPLDGYGFINAQEAVGQTVK